MNIGPIAMPVPTIEHLSGDPVILKTLARIRRALAELDSFVPASVSLPVLRNILSINEARESVAIDLSVARHEDIFRFLSQAKVVNPIAAQIVDYRNMLVQGFERVSTSRRLHPDLLLNIHGQIGSGHKSHGAGQTGGLMDVIHYACDEPDQTDPLLKQALIHGLFAARDDGQVARLAAMMCLGAGQQLSWPMLNLSRYFNHNRAQYLRQIELLKTTGIWNKWLIFNLVGLEQSIYLTLRQMIHISGRVENLVVDIQGVLPANHVPALQNLLLDHFYTRLQNVQASLGGSRPLAIDCLQLLESSSFLAAQRIGNERMYRNNRLFDLVKGSSH